MMASACVAPGRCKFFDIANRHRHAISTRPNRGIGKLRWPRDTAAPHLPARYARPRPEKWIVQQCVPGRMPGSSREKKFRLAIGRSMLGVRIAARRRGTGLPGTRRGRLSACKLARLRLYSGRGWRSPRLAADGVLPHGPPFLHHLRQVGQDRAHEARRRSHRADRYAGKSGTLAPTSSRSNRSAAIRCARSAIPCAARCAASAVSRSTSSPRKDARSPSN